jgi:hypothetical protein
MIAMEAKDRDTNLHGKLYTSTELWTKTHKLQKDW